MIGDMITILFWWEILKWLIITLILVIVLYFVIRAICKYQARKISEAIKYDYLAERTAEEICKRLVIIEKDRKGKAATVSKGESTIE